MWFFWLRFEELKQWGFFAISAIRDSDKKHVE
jgi:hypothetical protein